MCGLGIGSENYNPQVLYFFKAEHKGKLKTRYHCHDFIELSIVIKGNILYKINDNFCNIKKGQILVFNPGVYHCEETEDNAYVEEFHLGITGIKIEDFPKDFIPIKGMGSIVKMEKNYEAFYKVCEEMYEEQKKNQCGYDLMLKSMAMQLLVLTLRETSTVLDDKEKEYIKLSFESSEKQNIVDTISTYMEQNYNKDISLEKISKNMYLSPVYISKIFKEETGASPINHLIKIRLAKAKELLEEGELSVKAVAKEVGYDDAYHFSKIFKKYYGNPPSKI